MAQAFSNQRVTGLSDQPGRGASQRFPPEVAVHLVQLACERPDRVGRSLSQWDCTELARQLEREDLVESISPEMVRPILAHHKLKPWRHPLWLLPHTPRDAAFYTPVAEVGDLYTRPLRADEIVLRVDEKTSLQPRPRLHITLPAMPGLPNRVEHEYRRAGAVHLLAVFDTRTGRVYGQCYGHKQQQEIIALLEYLHAEVAATIRIIHLICDNAQAYHDKQVRQWLAYKSVSKVMAEATPTAASIGHLLVWRCTM
jgi:hypothetical protein